MGVKLLGSLGIPVHFILGNNDGEIFGIFKRMKDYPHFHLHKDGSYGDAYVETVDDVRIFMHHHPRIAELAAKSGEFDLCIHGHTHMYREVQMGDGLVLCPGALLGGRSEASFAIYDTQTKSVAKIML